MKKTAILPICLALLLLFVSCAGKSAVAVTEYTALLYENSGGGGGDRNSEQYDGERFEAESIRGKKNMGEKEEPRLCKSLSAYYSRTRASDERGYEIDEYTSAVGMEFIHLAYRAGTDRLVKFKVSPTYDRSYASPVHPDSDEAAYIAYAKQILADYAGASLEGWQIRVVTYRAEYGYSDGFLNYSHEIPENNAEYTVTFYKEISGIERSDSMYVTMTNVGEILAFSAENCDEAFQPYESVKIDRERIEEAAWKAFKNVNTGHAIREKAIDSTVLYTKDNALWAKVVIEYSFGEARGGVSYAVKVAELT